MIERLRWYKRNLQLTPEGVDRYWELVQKPTLGLRAASEFAALGLLITLHPLDYVPKKLPIGTNPNFEALLEKGYAEEVSDKYSHMTLTLGEHDPELLPTFRTYKKLAYEEEPTEEELDEALRILKERIGEEELLIAETRRGTAERLEKLGAPRGLIEATGGMPNLTISEVKESIGEPRTKSEKAIALDTAMSKLHWDPDLLRKLPKREQSVVGSSILSWLRQLAGDEVSNEEIGEYPKDG